LVLYLLQEAVTIFERQGGGADHRHDDQGSQYADSPSLIVEQLPQHSMISLIRNDPTLTRYALRVNASLTDPVRNVAENS
jgi:hypothetical protein